MTPAFLSWLVVVCRDPEVTAVAVGCIGNNLSLIIATVLCCLLGAGRAAGIWHVAHMMWDVVISTAIAHTGDGIAAPWSLLLSLPSMGDDTG
jgi:hypothetical protein